VTALKILSAEERTVVVLKDNDALVKRAGRNVPWLSLLSFNRLQAHDLFYCKRLLVLETAATRLNDFYAVRAAAGNAGKEARA
jgi:large subunit ribosomal protein L4